MLGLTIAAGMKSACSATTHSAIALVMVYVFGWLPCILRPISLRSSSDIFWQQLMTNSGSPGGLYTHSLIFCLSAFEYAVDTWTIAWIKGKRRINIRTSVFLILFYDDTSMYCLKFELEKKITFEFKCFEISFLREIKIIILDTRKMMFILFFLICTSRYM